ncbi:hypothetical protein RSAG8_04062, partial [Rhizoctonia solani AG-8 WAC10335]
MVITTPDGTSKLKPRPAVHAIRPWETLPLKIGGKDFNITGTPCVHLPVVPMHFDSWKHFVEPSTESAKVFVEAGLKDKVVWLEPGVAKQIL